MMADEDLYRYLVRQLANYHQESYCREDVCWVMSHDWHYVVIRMAFQLGRPVIEPAFTPQGKDFLLGIPVIVSERYGPPMVVSWSQRGHAELEIRLLEDWELLSR